jgi:broad specificity phosphatase PhoE
MSRALFLRHGESAGNAHTGAEPLAEADSDVLTERGREQARAAAVALAPEGATRLLTSPLRRARETADAVAEELDLAPSVLPYAHELHGGESFEDAVGRVRRLKAELEIGEPGELPLLVTHGIFTRLVLLDSLLGDELTAERAARVWNLGSHNCGLTVFAHGETRDPAGAEVPGWVCLTWMARPWSPP